MLELILFGVFAYLIGSIPTAVWVAKGFYEIDIREYGSGNAGATNTFRVLGTGPGIVVLLIDMLKGCAAAGLVYLQHEITWVDSFHWVNLKLIYGGLAVLGHLYPIFANFRGGKGIATLFGVIVAIHYLPALACAAVFLTILLSTRYVSLSSITAAISFPILTIVVFQKDNPYFIAFGICAAVLVLFTHQKNIKRLLLGNESKANIYRKRRNRNAIR
ncbi:MAG: glycerol-3-phosphate 1-O-acyltransferase PlsY [Bacteroidota bacterium]|nr:glycerol-3-phosphate 1-O-acyltransferase PlsY [Bacteroidota bacterium]